MQSIFNTEAPEKVRTLPDVPPAKSHKGEGLFGWTCLILFFAMLALLFLGCFDVYKNPQEHYPLHTVNQVEEPEAPAESTGPILRPVTQFAANNGSVGAQVPGADTIVATSGDHNLENREFIYYYWDNFYALYEQMGGYLSSYLDFNTPFDQQQVSETQNWNQYLSGMAANTWHQTMILCDEAEKAGFELSDEDLAYLENNLQSMAEHAASSGYADTEGYLQAIFDPSADLESYRAYNLSALTASSYAQSQYERLKEEVYDPAAEVLYCVNVRHILLQPEEGEEMESVKARAEALLEQWEQEGNENYFAALAVEHTTDPGSQSTGGLYEDVYPGQMVTNFNDWCFDESRQVGDTGIVETEYGYHLMYFSGHSDTVYSDGNAEAAQTAYTQWLDDLFAAREYSDLTANAVFTEKAK